MTSSSHSPYTTFAPTPSPVTDATGPLQMTMRVLVAGHVAAGVACLGLAIWMVGDYLGTPAGDDNSLAGLAVVFGGVIATVAVAQLAPAIPALLLSRRGLAYGLGLASGVVGFATVGICNVWLVGLSRSTSGASDVLLLLPLALVVVSVIGLCADRD